MGDGSPSSITSTGRRRPPRDAGTHQPAAVVDRGGVWYGYLELLRSACRFRLEPDLRYIYLGIRVARTLS